MSFNANKIRQIVKECTISELKNELEYTKSTPLDVNQDRIEALNTLIKMYTCGNNKKDDTDDIVNAVTQSLYHRDWHLLHDMHKTELLNNYINSSNYNDVQKKQLYKLIEQGINNELFKSKLSVDYNKKDAKILKINILVENGNGQFELKPKKSKKTKN